MLSRVAENLYWTGRYVERAETVARLLDSAFFLELDAAGLALDDDGSGPVEGVLSILGCRTAFEATASAGDRDAVLRFLTFDRKNSQSILSMVARARENARGTQEAIPAEVWSELNRMFLFLSGAKAQRRFAESPFEFYGGIKRSCVLWAGLVDGTLARDEIYQFLHAGRYLERADQVGRILRAKSHTLIEHETATTGPMRPIQWSSLLRSCSAYDSYLRTFRERVDPKGVVRYLVLDADFPRALRFCVARCREALHEVSGGDEDGYGSEAERLLGRLEGELRYIDVAEIFDRGLPRFLASVQETCSRVGQEFHRAYFVG